MSVIYKLSNTKSTIPARVKSVGKNLFDGEVTGDSNYELIKLSDKSFKISRKESSTGGDFFNIKFQKDTQYTLSGTHYQSVSGENTRLRVRYSDGTTETIGGHIPLIASNFSFTSAIGKTIERIGATYGTSNTGYTIYNDFQIEQGTTATAYEPYTETTQYLPTDVELRSLPNGVKDETSVVDGIKTQNVSGDYTLQTSDMVATSAFTNVDAVRIDKSTFINISSFTDDYPTNIEIHGLSRTRFIGGGFDNVGSIGKYFTSPSSNRLFIIIAKGTTLTQAREQLAGTTLIYQLETPEVIDIPVLGNLLGHPSGTIYRENAIGEVGFYDDGLSVSHEDLPIHEIDFIDIVNKNDGTKTRLDKSTAVISGDKKSFTHPQLSDGDLVSWDYYYPKELSTVGEATYGYFDSRFVVIDDVTGDAYRLVPEVSSGVLTWGVELI